MKQDKKEQTNPNWQKPNTNPSMPHRQEPNSPHKAPGKKPHNGCGC